MGQQNGGERYGNARRSGRRSSRRSRRRGFTRWLRHPVVLISMGMVAAALAAGGVILAQRSLSQPASPESAQDDAAGVTTQVGMQFVPEAPPRSPVEEEVAAMPLEEKVGQMMMVGFDGAEPGASITSAIKDRHVGAVILFGRNISSPEQVTALNTSLQALAAQAKQPARLIIATDQEGGKTRRFETIGPYYSQPMIGEMPDEAAAATAQQQASATARDLKKLGVNTNLAPVADVSSGWGTVMDGRSYGAEAELVAELSARAVKGYNNATTISCPKHFPGHGSADEDSEEASATVESSREELDSVDLVPFREVIKEGAPMIMVAHLSVPALDPSGTPASLSRAITTDLLRKGMGFNGVIITDDLEMKAITGTRSVGEAAVAAVYAGADIVIVAHTAARQAEAHDAIVAAVRAGKLKEEDINKSVTRILEMKRKYRLEN